MTTPACNNFAGIVTNRFMLGLTEATLNPGYVLMTSIWYTSAEQPLRLLAYYYIWKVSTMPTRNSGFHTNLLLNTANRLIGYAVAHIKHGLAKWQYVPIFFSAISTLVALEIVLIPSFQMGLYYLW